MENNLRLITRREVPTRTFRIEANLDGQKTSYFLGDDSMASGLFGIAILRQLAQQPNISKIELVVNIGDFFKQKYQHLYRKR
ncbi:hypothetical protein A2966_03400 [Candidatus Roizmanbacteria bacterium RIFCSPLOWO2_01_FULL_41_22]|nr:MAG: hypothetical protein A2966_03400 [Candidatus Roizmanbacteria bacterium RIFCSPLOWO2_01_FULL_41_22]